MSSHVEGREYDIIFAGGGTAACAAVGRLAKRNPDLSILIIEAGRNNKDDPLVIHPAIFPAHLAPDTQSTLSYKSLPEQNLNGRESVVQTGGILGGGSSVNFLLHNRAQAIDFDSWETEGWDFNSLLPLMKRLETWHPTGPGINQDVHGHEGPVHISYGTNFQEASSADALAAAVATGQREFADMSDCEAVGGFSPWPKFISPDGKRQDAATCYLHPLLAAETHPNLHVLLEHKVSRVIFDASNKATGVEYMTSDKSQLNTDSGLNSSRKAIAKKLVVLAAGAFGTPTILERSGVGDTKLLAELGIEVISELPDIGEHYQDHQILLFPYKSNLDPEQTNDALLSGRSDFLKLIATGDKVLGWNAIDVAGKLRPTDAEVQALGAEFQEAWDADYKNKPTKPLMMFGYVASFLGDHQTLEQANGRQSQYFSIGSWTAYSYSRGSVHIASRNLSVGPNFKTGFLNHEADLKKHVWAYKKQREIARRTNAYRGELASGHPQFGANSKAALQDIAARSSFANSEERRLLPAIEYDKEDDKAIEQYIRDNVSTCWHSCGTCRMAPRSKGGVVDASLNVYGVFRLKCVDLSIVPQNVGANTHHTALLIGEKAADIIAKDLGLQV